MTAQQTATNCACSVSQNSFLLLFFRQFHLLTVSIPQSENIGRRDVC